MTAAIAAVAAVAEVPATSTAAAIPAVAAVAAIPATGSELEADRVAEALAVTEKAKVAAAAAAGKPLDAIQGDAPVKPEGVPDKFWDAKTGEVNYVEWNKAHTALETQFHAPTKTPEVLAAEKVIADAEAAAGVKPGEVTLASVRKEAGVEFAEKGELTAETYTKFESIGVDRATVDSTIAGMKAQGSQMTDAAHGAAEGEENYSKMLVWAEAELDEGETKKFNALITSNDESVIKGAVTDLYAKYKENVTVEGERIGGIGASSGATTFA
ncbi:hypothetical protein LCGC14_3120480, partial [marine sediment metagenome]